MMPRGLGVLSEKSRLINLTRRNSKKSDKASDWGGCLMKKQLQDEKRIKKGREW